MTDNEIIKALECCSTYKGKCTDCPAFVKVDRSNCKKVLFGAVEIINRLQAEIDRLNRDLDLVVRNTIEVTKTAMQLARDKAIKEFAERLKANTIEFGAAKGIQREVDRLVKEMVGEDK